MLTQFLYFVMDHILQSIPSGQDMLWASELGELNLRTGSLHVDLESYRLDVHIGLIVDA
jgi:hypothetical protein